MEEKVISIAVATYNMENYLSRCLDSVLMTDILNKIEIIIVNDGSTDNSLSIAQSYKVKFPKSIIIIDKPNGHYGSCINAALKIATGKYFRILDPDDWFDSDVFVQYVNKLESIDVDIVITNYSREYVNGNRIVAFSETYTKNIIHEKECDFKKYDFKDGNLLCMHSMTYYTQLLIKTNLRLTEGICYTDTEYCFYPLEHVNSFIYLDVVLYKYYIGREGQSVSPDSIKKYKEHSYKIVNRMIEYLSLSNNTVSKQQHLIMQRILRYYYRSVIVYNHKNCEDEVKLKKIDSALNEINHNLYEQIAETKYIGVKYIKLWREKNIYLNETKRYTCFNIIKRIKSSLFRI
jgi:glycosyltransferase involved in cell wall biosynthesis